MRIFTSVSTIEFSNYCNQDPPSRLLITSSQYFMWVGVKECSVSWWRRAGMEDGGGVYLFTGPIYLCGYLSGVAERPG